MKCCNKNHTNRHYMISPPRLKRFIVSVSKRGNTLPYILHFYSVFARDTRRVIEHEFP